ncbi:Mitochondrial chaperone Frataxin [Rhizopus azygosporus]|uniref:ferroxidase n=1 Tax=Rhizopus azygosporus TaxID=86630 RepID=A0A367JHF4_RHIAZ|nr:Mitochondrial chaperone Frataxin [Rhizopus azygosporus]CEG62907.1 hypothetical protein RMATCC62417_00147 [Rhizopus microsporus]CEJ01556.1 hypothetical protein RMCBS344292_15579 [Rhizopus microsporus]
MFKHLTRQTLQQAKRLSPQIALRPPSARIYARAIPRFIHNTSISFDNNTRPTFTPTTLNTDRYHRLSDEILEHIVAKLEEIGDEIDMKGFDVEYSQGVMTLSVGEHGTYVINKQPPNHQIWLSSPVSGPQRFDYDEQHRKWFYARYNQTLDEVLNNELSKALDRKVDLLEHFDPQEE